MKCADIQKLTLFIEQALPDDELEEVAQHLGTCTSCAKLLEDVSSLTARLGADPGEFDTPTFSKDIQKLIQLGQEKKVAPLASKRVSLRTVSIFSIAAAAIAAIMFAAALFESQPVNPTTDGYRARGASGAKTNQWVSIQVFKKVPNGFKAVDKFIEPNDALAFAYRNQNQNRCNYLMIFAINDEGEIFWYYPAYTQDGVYPSSTPIESTNKAKQLPDAIEHNLKPGPLSLIALFLESPLNVKNVEHSVEMQLAKGVSLDTLHFDFDNCGLHTINFSVSSGTMESQE